MCSEPAFSNSRSTSNICPETLRKLRRIVTEISQQKGGLNKRTEQADIKNKKINLTIDFAPSYDFDDDISQEKVPTHRPSAQLGLTDEELCHLKEAGDRLLKWLKKSDEHAAQYLLEPSTLLQKRGDADPKILKKLARAGQPSDANRASIRIEEITFKNKKG